MITAQALPTSVIDDNGNYIAMVVLASIALLFISFIFVWFKNRIEADSKVVTSRVDDMEKRIEKQDTKIDLQNAEIKELHKKRDQEKTGMIEDLFRSSAQMMGVLQNTHEIMKKNTDVLEKIYTHASEKLGIKK